MADNFPAKDGSGATFTIRSTDIGGGIHAVHHVVNDGSNHLMPAMDAASRRGYITITDGTNTMPTGDAAARGLYVRPTDGTNSMPSMDAVGRAGFVKVTDGTNTMPTMDTVARRGYFTATDGTNSMPTMDAAARAGYVFVTNGTQTMPTGDAAARKIFTQHTDGTNSSPSMDAAARPGYFTQVGTAANGLSKGKARDLAATVIAVKASAGTLYMLTIENAQAAKIFIQVFDVASGSVALATTNPDWEFEVAANSTYTLPIPPQGLPFGTAISIASTTGEKGLTGSAAGVQAFWTYL